MRKTRIVIVSFLLSAVLFAGCAGQEQPVRTETLSPGQSSEPGAISSVAEDLAAGMEEAVEQYRALYHAEHVYRDALVPQKVLLIGEEQLVELTWVSGYEQTKAIERSSVIRTETGSLDAWDSVRIYDKTGQCISIMVEPGTAEELVAFLSPHQS